MARILVVDDVRFIARMIAGVFERIGHLVETAGDGEEALRRVEAALPDLIVMDAAMPKLDGLEVTRRLRAAERTRDVPILLVTSRADSSTLATAAEVGVDDHLAKPFESQDLLAKSSQLLGGHPMTFDLALLGDAALVTALPDDLDLAAAEHVRPALEHARSVALALVLLDLTRVTRMDASVGDAILAFDESFRREGGSLEVVRPQSGLGIRGFLAQVSTRLRTHDDLESARAVLDLPPATEARPIVPPRKRRARAPEAGPVAKEVPGSAPPPGAPAIPAPAPGPASAPYPTAPPVTRTGAARGVVLETHPRATIVRIHRDELDDEALELVQAEVIRFPRVILLELPSVVSIDTERAGRIGEIAAVAEAAGGSLRVVNPPRGVEAAMTNAGLGALVLRTRMGNGASTRASS